MPPPAEASQTFSFQVPTDAVEPVIDAFKKQEIGRPRSAPPFDRTGVAGMNQSFEM